VSSSSSTDIGAMPLARSHREGGNAKGRCRHLPSPREGNAGRQLEENQSPRNQSSLTCAYSLRNITLSSAKPRIIPESNVGRCNKSHTVRRSTVS